MTVARTLGAPSPGPALPRRPRWSATRGLAWGLSVLAVTAFAALAALIFVESVPFLRQAGLGFFAGTDWDYRHGVFGLLPLLYGTVAVSAVALVVAVPLGLGAALLTAEVLGPRLRLPVKAGIELLAGIPSVVYGLLGILFLRQWVEGLLTPFDPLSGDTLLTGGLLLAVMILPTVTSLSDDALRAVPASQRQAARGLGLTRAETVLSVSLPQALPGLAAAALLGLGRALGETIAVFLVIGRQDGQWPERLMSLAPLAEAGQTLTTKLGGPEVFLALGDPQHWGALMALALVLLLLVAGVTAIGLALAGRAGRGHRA